VPAFPESLPSVSSQEYHDICGKRDDDAMSVHRGGGATKKIDAVPLPPLGLMGVAGDLCVVRRRRCPCIASSSLLDLTSQDPSANVMVFLGRDTGSGITAFNSVQGDQIHELGILVELFKGSVAHEPEPI